MLARDDDEMVILSSKHAHCLECLPSGDTVLPAPFSELAREYDAQERDTPMTSMDSLRSRLSMLCTAAGPSALRKATRARLRSTT